MRSKRPALAAIVAVAATFIFGVANIALAETFCPEGGERFTGSEKFCPSHGAVLKPVSGAASSKAGASASPGKVTAESAAAKWYEQARNYYTGGGVEGDQAKAAALLKKAANAGNAEAQTSLGMMYFSGDKGFEVDNQEALKWFRRAAEQESKVRHLARQALGTMYVDGRGVDKDLPRAESYWLAAAESGDAYIQQMLGRHYEHGSFGRVDLDMARKYYRLAAAQGDEVAEIMLANLGGDLVAWNEQGEKLQKDKKYREAMALFRKAANQGYAPAQYNMAKMYQLASGVDENFAEAYRWFVLAAEQGYTDAQLSLGNMYIYGRGVDLDLPRAESYWLAAAESGDAYIQQMLGRHYEHGSFGRVDLDMARKYYRLAAAQGDEVADALLADLN